MTDAQGQLEWGWLQLGAFGCFHDENSEGGVCNSNGVLSNTLRLRAVSGKFGFLGMRKSYRSNRCHLSAAIAPR
ncbi:MAG TPA: hypothetical protein VNZ02_13165, partial [Steroidobacteraceae bacterium]|nr:hypothetical protein [Steroidobacteraceae bacterium]